MNRHTTALLFALFALSVGCDRATTLDKIPEVDHAHWSVTVESFHQSETDSTLRVFVDTPVKARITFHESDGGTNQKFLYPGGTSYEIRKRLETTDQPGVVYLKTTANGNGPSITALSSAPHFTIPKLQRRVLNGPTTVAFGETVVLAENRTGNTTVSVDLEPDIDPNLDSFRDVTPHPTRDNPAK